LQTATPRSFASLNEIPNLAVGTVEEVVRLGEMPTGERRFPWENRRFKARIGVCLARDPRERLRAIGDA